jgi:hypothetical protein
MEGTGKKVGHCLVTVAYGTIILVTLWYALTRDVFIGKLTSGSVLPYFAVSAVAFFLWFLYKIFGSLRIDMKRWETFLMALFPFIFGGCFYLWLLWSE